MNVSTIPAWAWDIGNFEGWIWTVALLLIIVIVLGIAHFDNKRRFSNKAPLCDDSLAGCNGTSSDRRDTF